MSNQLRHHLSILLPQPSLCLGCLARRPLSFQPQHFPFHFVCVNFIARFNFLNVDHFENKMFESPCPYILRAQVSKFQWKIGSFKFCSTFLMRTTRKFQFISLTREDGVRSWWSVLWDTFFCASEISKLPCTLQLSITHAPPSLHGMPLMVVPSLLSAWTCPVPIHSSFSATESTPRTLHVSSRMAVICTCSFSYTTVFIFHWCHITTCFDTTMVRL